MNWSYVAGYSDGEGCLLINVVRDKRPERTKGSVVDGWNIIPCWSIQTYDYDTIESIHRFLVAEGFAPRRLDTPSKGIRIGQTRQAYRVSVAGREQLSRLFAILVPLSINKREQYQLYFHLATIFAAKGHKWSRELFIEAMGAVDSINALKSRHRGKMNAEYFRELWKGGDANGEPRVYAASNY